ncbi:MAG TPA: response regulator transcription factor [Usitatibacter sp.]|jgi:two-component system, NarL family, invasion response regulator UvrY|nr:response regulator transcription factor [Usitatibacter sp.]
MSFASSSVMHGTRGAPVKVLIADDHPVVRQGLKQMLSSDPEVNVVGEARDGDEAFDLAHQVDWDVAVLDYSMPGRGGVELLSDVKHDYPDRAVLILSIYPEDPHGLRALKAGAAGYISKESAGDELTAAVKKVATGGRYVSPALAEKLASRLTPEQERPPHERLSDREYRVMWLLASGKTLHQIAEEMRLSPSTVSTYRGRILKKLGLNTNVDLVHYAMKHRLIE